jgi:SAM-dependent methyltransferase
VKNVLDDRYYEVARPGSMGERLMIKARRKIYADFVAKVQPRAHETILDVGISDILNDGANALEHLYPHRQKISACGLGEATEFQATFPEIPYTKINPNERLPYASNQFDIAISNAVLEHVGSVECQISFVKEVVRVAQKIFIVVPHRFFPIEHHTGIPFLHYANSTFRITCWALGKHHWARPENLILITKSHLRTLSVKGSEIGYTGLLVGPVASNLFMYLDKSKSNFDRATGSNDTGTK